MRRFSLVGATGPRWKAVVLLAVGVAGAGAALAAASVPNSSGMVHACYQVTINSADATVPVTTPGNVRIIDPTAGQTCRTSSPPSGPPAEAELSWNQSGQTGATGPQGPPGAPERITIVNPPLTGTQSTIGQATLGAGSHVLTLAFVALDLEGQTTPAVPRKAPGRTQFEAITLARGVTSDPAFYNWAHHTRFAAATITVSNVRPPAGKHLQITLTGAVISSIHIGSSGPGGPIETITISSSQPLKISHPK